MTAPAVRGSAPAPSPPAIVARDLARRFGARWALTGVDLTVEWSEAVALVGPNGSGKSTLLRMLSGALSPSRGEAWVGGHRVAGRDGQVRCIVGLLAGDSYLYEDLSASENLIFALRMCAGRVDDRSVARCLERVGLSSAAHVRVRALSSGMRKRLALARVLATEPRVLLLDEPYANLDDDGARLVDRTVREAKDDGRAVLVATHRRDRAGAVCDATVRLAGGRIAEEDPPARAPWAPAPVLPGVLS